MFVLILTIVVVCGVAALCEWLFHGLTEDTSPWEGLSWEGGHHPSAPRTTAAERRLAPAHVMTWGAGSMPRVGYRPLVRRGHRSRAPYPMTQRSMLASCHASTRTPCQRKHGVFGVLESSVPAP